MGILEACLISGLIVGGVFALVFGGVWLVEYTPEWVLVALFLVLVFAIVAFSIWASSNNFLGIQ